MTCRRCQGLMVSDRFIDLQETGHLWMTGWRCMNCGHVVDPVTEENRKLQAEKRLTVAPVNVNVQAVAPVPSSVHEAA